MRKILACPLLSVIRARGHDDDAAAADAADADADADADSASDKLLLDARVGTSRRAPDCWKFLSNDNNKLSGWKFMRR
jgi:hypothetical protein